MSSIISGRRRMGGWGFAGVEFSPSPQLLSWLEERIGSPSYPITADDIRPPTGVPRALPQLGAELSTDAVDRLFHARGQGLADIIRIRSGSQPALPDGVCRPRDAEQVAAVLAAASAHAIQVIPWGGGTSVTGGVNVSPDHIPVVSLDLERMSGLSSLDAISGLAVFGPGTTGPVVEEELARHGLTLGHFPQSWELATVGGWVATRSSGQESLGYGRIEDLVAGLEVEAPRGRLSLPARPASAAGPDLRQLMMGSEGRLGVISEVTLRVRARPAVTLVEAALLPELDSALKCARELTRWGLPLTMLRVSDAPETQVAMAIGLASSAAAPVVRSYLKLRRFDDRSCLVLYGAAGDAGDAKAVLRGARSLLRRHRAAALGASPGRHWLRDRFRHPYLRESLLDRGVATDTLETAVPWSRVSDTREQMIEALTNALADDDERVAVLCHVSHPYRDGASLYFTFFFRTAADPDLSIARWARLKRTANDALVRLGATLSHHHGVGQWHAPWLAGEIGERGHDLLAAAAREMDPGGILNRHVLLDRSDRLEE